MTVPRLPDQEPFGGSGHLALSRETAGAANTGT